ncbi:hypothetical protein [Capnocytophaga canimorsus]|uniref:hypothetical protein n=1 Tax=Capnocytophaga canimorsus TaxID=28188 RepID=UPI001EE0F887|nr:hypothetical protein [Capnocytophaga canimorsus]MDT9500257.1 hypothetical protein [Capnocytophaga canimorsus]GJQ05429.1 hypothetical protein CAPN009_18440 [Capnocytophaga canimorsus]
MLEEKKYILKLINNINKGNSVSVPSIDMRVMRKYPSVIYEDNLKIYLLELEEEGYIELLDEITLKITQKGIIFLKYENQENF